MINDLVFDLDGVILSFQEAFEAFYKKQLKLYGTEDRLPPLKILEMEFMQSEDCYTMPSLIDSKDFNSLTFGKKVYFITNMPSFTISGRKINLSNLGFNFENVFAGGFENYGEKDYPLKSEVILNLLGENKEFIFVDDYAINCDDVVKRFPKVKAFLLKGLHDFNNEPEAYQKAETWSELYDKIKQTIL